jgi:hypothetical protein
VGVARAGLPPSLLVFAALVVAHWILVALPGGVGFPDHSSFAAWVVVEAVLVGLLLRGGFVAWSILLLLNVLAAIALAALAAVPPSAAAALAFVVALGKLAALVAPGARAHVRQSLAAG